MALCRILKRKKFQASVIAKKKPQALLSCLDGELAVFY